jgi:hypothetical protein
MTDQLTITTNATAFTEASSSTARYASDVRVAVAQAAQVDTASKALALFDLSTQQRRTIVNDPLARVAPVASSQARSSSVRPYTIWQAIDAVAELFKPQAIATSDILDVLSKVSDLVEKNVQKVTSYQTQVDALQAKINKEMTSEQWMGWGMAIMGVVFGALAGFAIGGPVGLVAGLAVGSADLLFSSQIEIDGKPILNYVLDKISGGKINLGSTSVFGYAGEGAYDALTAMGMPKGEKGKEVVEGATQILIGVAVGLLVGNVVAAEASSAAAVEDDLEEDGIQQISPKLLNAQFRESSDLDYLDDDDDFEDEVDAVDNSSGTLQQEQQQQSDLTNVVNTTAPTAPGPTAPATPSAPTAASAPTPSAAPQPAAPAAQTPQSTTATTGQGNSTSNTSESAEQSGGSGVGGVGSTTGSANLGDIEEAEEAEGEVVDVARTLERQEAEEATEQLNPGGVAQNQARAGLRGFVMGLTSANNVAQANTGDGNAYADFIEAAGASKEVAGWVGTGIGMGIGLVSSVGGLWIGAAPGTSTQLFSRLIRYAAYVQPVVTAGTSGAEAWTDYSLYRTYSALQPLKTDLDNAEGAVQMTQSWQKSIMGMMTSTTNMITQSTETAVAMLNQTRQMIQTIFEA